MLSQMWKIKGKLFNISYPSNNLVTVLKTFFFNYADIYILYRFVDARIFKMFKNNEYWNVKPIIYSLWNKETK